VSKLPVVSEKQLCKLLKQLGYSIDHQTESQYPDYKPYPSALLLGWVEKEPFHVVIALDYESNYCFVITAYRPDLEHFKSDYKTRRKHDN
jgi:signal recognition particle subunit SEC65